MNSLMILHDFKVHTVHTDTLKYIPEILVFSVVEFMHTVCAIKCCDIWWNLDMKHPCKIYSVESFRVMHCHSVIWSRLNEFR